MDTHEVLVAARNIVARGWTQRDFGYHGGRCAWGACLSSLRLLRPACGDITDLPEYEEASRVLCGVIPLPYPSWGAVADWNDKPERTKDEVLAAFDKAIAATAPEPIDPLHGVEVEQRVEAVAA